MLIYNRMKGAVHLVQTCYRSFSVLEESLFLFLKTSVVCMQGDTHVDACFWPNDPAKFLKKSGISQ